MCLSCGCGHPTDDHGDPKHITLAGLQAAAKAGEISDLEAAQNILKTYQEKVAKGARR